MFRLEAAKAGKFFVLAHGNEARGGLVIAAAGRLLLLLLLLRLSALLWLLWLPAAAAADIAVAAVAAVGGGGGGGRGRSWLQLSLRQKSWNIKSTVAKACIVSMVAVEAEGRGDKISILISTF